jgi:spore maturation protein CgeB
MVRSGYSPSVRLFEAAARGVPIISDHWPGIDFFFEPQREILLAEDSAKVVEYLQGLDERARLRLAELARMRILRQHSSLRRARELERYLLELRGTRQTRTRRALASEPTLTASTTPDAPAPATEP